MTAVRHAPGQQGPPPVTDYYRLQGLHVGSRTSPAAHRSLAKSQRPDTSGRPLALLSLRHGWFLAHVSRAIILTLSQLPPLLMDDPGSNLTHILQRRAFSAPLLL